MDPRVAACLGFVIAAIGGSFASAAWMYWKHVVDIFAGMPPGMRSGGMAFSVNLPGMGLEFAAYVMGFFATIALGSTWFWSRAARRSWYFVAGLLSLVPVVALLAVRLGWFRY
jgi:hypothetical protein